MPQKPRLFPRRRAAALGVTLLLSTGIAASTRADVAIVSQVAESEVVQPALNQAFALGTTPPPRRESAHSPQTVTTYYKGANARTEVAGGTTTLYDGASGKIYTLSPADKTYYAQSYQDILEAKQASSGEQGAQTKVDSSIDVKPGEQTAVLLGAAAKAYTVSGVVTITPQRRSFGGARGGGGGRHHGRGGGGFPGGGGGGFPGGGGGFPLLQQGSYPGDGGPDGGQGGGYSRGGGRTRTVEVSGEFWLSDAVKLPDDKKATALPLLQAASMGGSAALKALVDSLNKKKDIPLRSRLTFTHTVAGTGAQDALTTATQVTSVSFAPISDALFRLPLGYTQVAAPAQNFFPDGLDDGGAGSRFPGDAQGGR